jgi:hypothetical protein
MGRRHGAVHGAARLDHRQHRRAVNGGESACDAAQPEGRGGQLYSESRSLHSGERLDRRSIRHAARVCARHCGLHDFLGVLRARHECAADGGGAYFARDRRSHDDASRAAHRDPHLSQGGTAASDEFRHHPGADRAVAWPDGRRLDRPLVVVAGDLLRDFRWASSRCGSFIVICRIIMATPRARSM